MAPPIEVLALSKFFALCKRKVIAAFKTFTTAYKGTSRLERLLHGLILVALLAGVIEITLEAKKPSNIPADDKTPAEARSHAIYWAQTISGNWPGEPPDPLKENRGETILALMAAITINLATLGALGAGFMKLTRLERSMDTRDMIAWHNILLKQQLEEVFIEILGNNQKLTVKDAINKSFVRASNEFKEYSGIIGKTPEGAAEYINRAKELNL